jgi:phage head maturation protease
MTDKPKETWTYNPSPLLESPRKVSGVFHKAVVDKDGEMITPDAIRESIPDYMHLPALHDFHKERPVGLATKVWENSDGSFGFEGVIKATEDCDDVWEKIKKGNYDHVSIFGKREQGNNNCSLPTPLRSGACITTGVRLDSISVCDGNARNDSTSLEVRKGMRMVFDADELKKAETTDGKLQHASTDYAKEKKCGTKCKRKITVEKADDIDDEDRMEQRGTKTGSTTKEKGAYLPHRETGSEHPKRSKEGYPLKTGGDTAPASHHPAGEKGTAPPVENFTERNARVEILRERIADKAKDTTAESARKQDDSAKPKRGTIGRSIGVKKAEDMDVEKGEERIPPAEEKTPTKTRRAKEGDKKATWAKKPAFDKADTEDEENWQKEAFDKLEEEEPGRAADYRQHERGGEKGK